MIFRIVLFFVVIIAASLYISYLNKSEIEFFYFPESSVTVSTLLILTIGFIFGSLLSLLIGLDSRIRSIFLAHRLRKLEKSDKAIRDGINLGYKGYDKKAIRRFRFAFANNKKSHLTIKALGSQLRSSGYIDDAIACHKKGVILDPENVDFYYQLALDYKQQGAIESGIVVLQEAINKTGESKKLLTMLRDLKLISSDSEDLLDIAKKVAERKDATDNDKKIVATILFEIATSDKLKGKDQERIKLLVEAVDIYPEFGYAYVELLKYDDAGKNLKSYLKSSLKEGSLDVAFEFIRKENRDTLWSLFDKIEKDFSSDQKGKDLLKIVKGFALVKERFIDQGIEVLSEKSISADYRFLTELALGYAEMMRGNYTIAKDQLEKGTDLGLELTLSYICTDCCKIYSVYRSRCLKCSSFASLEPLYKI